MTSNETLHRALLNLLTELLDGPASGPAWVLNPGDAGLLRSLDKLSAEQASARPPSGGACIAAHVEHLRYGLELLNRSNRGEDPFADADYSASWTRGAVSDAEWASRRADLRREADRWREALGAARERTGEDMTAVASSVVHLAYHLGAIRQMDRATRGPAAGD